jgi:hypothetical protein
MIEYLSQRAFFIGCNMTDISFMQKKYSLDELLTHYLNDIKSLRNLALTPADETKLQLYYQAANTFKRAAMKDWVQFALSWGRSTSGMSGQLREAFPMVLGYRVYQPSALDLGYAQILLVYAQAFRIYKVNLKDWMLRFLITSNYSPLHGYFDRELEQVINNTKQHIAGYQVLF